MATATITLKIPEGEKRAASRILRARGTTLARRLRACVREIIEEEEDAELTALARERLRNLKPEECTPLEDFIREMGWTPEQVEAAKDIE